MLSPIPKTKTCGGLRCIGYCNVNVLNVKEVPVSQIDTKVKGQYLYYLWRVPPRIKLVVYFAGYGVLESY